LFCDILFNKPPQFVENHLGNRIEQGFNHSRENRWQQRASKRGNSKEQNSAISQL